MVTDKLAYCLYLFDVMAEMDQIYPTTDAAGNTDSFSELFLYNTPAEALWRVWSQFFGRLCTRQRSLFLSNRDDQRTATFFRHPCTVQEIEVLYGTGEYVKKPTKSGNTPDFLLKLELEMSVYSTLCMQKRGRSI